MKNKTCNQDIYTLVLYRESLEFFRVSFTTEPCLTTIVLWTIIGQEYTDTLATDWNIEYSCKSVETIVADQLEVV